MEDNTRKEMDLFLFIHEFRNCCYKDVHPDVEQLRNDSKLKSCVDSKFIDVINAFHARCKCCNQHIYARSDPNDKLSYFVDHINSFDHLLKLPFVNKDESIIEVSENNEWFCNACEKYIQPITIFKHTDILIDINNHLESFSHKHNAFLMTDPDSALLVALSFTPILKSKIVNAKCKICDCVILFTIEEHLKFTSHLYNLKKYIKNIYDFDVKNFDADFVTLFEKMVLDWENPKEIVKENHNISVEQDVKELKEMIENNSPPQNTSTPSQKNSHYISVEQDVKELKEMIENNSLPQNTSTVSQKNSPKKGNCLEFVENSERSGPTINGHTEKVYTIHEVPHYRKKIDVDRNQDILRSRKQESCQTIEKDEIEIYISDVRSEMWKKLQLPHPDSVSCRSDSVFKNDVDNSIYDIVNDIHAYCIPCERHLYSAASDSDITSYYVRHINIESHIHNLKYLPEECKIFETIPNDENNSKCNACSVIVPKIDNSKDEDLKIVLKKHNANLEHVQNVFLMMDPDTALLISIAHIPYFKKLTMDLECKLCNTPYKDNFNVEKHIKCNSHLKYLKEFLESTFDMDLNKLRSMENLKVVLRKMAKITPFFNRKKLNELKKRENNLSLKKNLKNIVESLNEIINGIDDTRDISCLNIREIGKLLKDNLSFITEEKKSCEFEREFSQNEDHDSEDGDCTNYNIEDMKKKSKTDFGKFTIMSIFWKDFYGLHPLEVVGRKPMSFSSKSGIDLINSFHAYCQACGVHIYSRSDPFDVSSYFEDHINKYTHKKKMQLLEKGHEIFELDYSQTLGEDTWKCNACLEYLLPDNRLEIISIKNLIKNHITTFDHKENIHIASDKDLSFLVAVSLTAMFLETIKTDENGRRHCKVCNLYLISSESVEKHIKRLKHLDEVKNILENDLNFSFKEKFEDVYGRMQRVLFLLKSKSVLDIITNNEDEKEQDVNGHMVEGVKSLENNYEVLLKSYINDEIVKFQTEVQVDTENNKETEKVEEMSFIGMKKKRRKKKAFTPEQTKKVRSMNEKVAKDHITVIDTKEAVADSKTEENIINVIVKIETAGQVDTENNKEKLEEMDCIEMKKKKTVQTSEQTKIEEVAKDNIIEIDTKKVMANSNTEQTSNVTVKIETEELSMPKLDDEPTPKNENVAVVDLTKKDAKKEIPCDAPKNQIQNIQSVNTDFSKLTLQEKKSLEVFLIQMAQKHWKQSHRLHQLYLKFETTVKADVNQIWKNLKTKGFSAVNKQVVTVINNVHAYCEACQIHIISNTDEKDPSSYLESHINTDSHSEHTRSFPRKCTVLFQPDNKLLKCLPCKISCIKEKRKKSHVSSSLPGEINVSNMEIEKTDETLEDYIESHMRLPEHSHLTSVYLDPVNQNLVTLGNSSFFMLKIERGAPSKCELCHINFQNNVREHIRTRLHLEEIKKYLTNQFKIDINQLDKVDVQQELWILMSASQKPQEVSLDSSTNKKEEKSTSLDAKMEFTFDAVKPASTKQVFSKNFNITINAPKFFPGFSKKDKKECRQFLSHINDLKWRVPSTIHPAYNRFIKDDVTDNIRQLIPESDKKYFQFLNRFHVFCNACDQHISSSYLNDGLEMFFAEHSNNETHKKMLLAKPKVKEIFSRKRANVWECQICPKTLVIEEKSAVITVLLSDHLRSSNHKHSINLLNDDCTIILHALSTTPYFANKFLPKNGGETKTCLICNSDFRYEKEHYKSEGHLNNIRNYLSQNMLYKIEDLSRNIGAQRNLWRKMMSEPTVTFEKCQTQEVPTLKACSKRESLADIILESISKVEKEKYGNNKQSISEETKVEQQQLPQTKVQLSKEDTSYSDLNSNTKKTKAIPVSKLNIEVKKDSPKNQDKNIKKDAESTSGFIEFCKQREGDHFFSNLGEIRKIEFFDYLMHINGHKWMEHLKPHKSLLINEDVVAKESAWRKIKDATKNEANKFLEIISDNHVYCWPCRWHIYSGSSSKDKNSYFIDHINCWEHCEYSRKFSRDQEVFEELANNIWRCNVCQRTVIPFESPREKLENSVVNHLRTMKHMESNSIFSNPQMLVMVSISTSELFKDFISSSNQCELCQVYYQFKIRHLLSPKHLSNLLIFIHERFQFNINYLCQDNNIEALWKLCYNDKIKGISYKPAVAETTANKNDVSSVSNNQTETNCDKVNSVKAEAPGYKVDISGVSMKQVVNETTRNNDKVNSVSIQLAEIKAFANKVNISGVSMKPIVNEVTTNKANVSVSMKPVVNEASVNKNNISSVSNMPNVNDTNRWMSIITDIRTNKWVDIFKPHSSMIISPEKSMLDVIDSHFICTINKYHAFCLLCQHHIYSKVEPTDHYSYFVSHLNSHKHVSKLESAGKDVKIIVETSRGIWECLLCKNIVPWQNINETSLDLPIKNHLKQFNHKKELIKYTYSVHSTLIGFSLTEALKKFTTISQNVFKCRFCSLELLSSCYYSHLKSAKHLNNIIEFMKKEKFIESIQTIIDNFVLEDLLKKMESHNLSKSVTK